MMFKGFFYKANSASPEMHDITLSMDEEDTKSNLIFHVIHVTGTRIKELGIYGLYRGDFLEGIITRKYPLEMLPLDVGALDRVGGLNK